MNKPLANLQKLTKEVHASLGWHHHPRNGKIARLPEPTRNQINLMLENGLPYATIIDELRQSGCAPYPISEMNISNWYRGGYQDWQREKAKVPLKCPTRSDIIRLLSGHLEIIRAAMTQRQQGSGPVCSTSRLLKPWVTAANRG